MLSTPSWSCPARYTTTGFEICHYRSQLDPVGYPCQRVCNEDWRKFISWDMMHVCPWCGAMLVLEHFNDCPMCGAIVRMEGGE
jgi:rubrerythrin